MATIYLEKGHESNKRKYEEQQYPFRQLNGLVLGVVQL